MRYDDIILSISVATEYFEDSPISRTAIFIIQNTEDDASYEIEGTAILLRNKRPSLYPSMLSWHYSTMGQNQVV